MEARRFFFVLPSIGVASMRMDRDGREPTLLLLLFPDLHVRANGGHTLAGDLVLGFVAEEGEGE